MYKRDFIYSIEDVLPKQNIFAAPLNEGTPSFQNAFSDGVDPMVIGSGDIQAELQQQAGVIYSGKTAFDNTETGYRLGIDGTTAKFYIGDSSSYLNWTGSALNIAGVLTASQLHIPDQDTTANSFHVQSDGDTWWGATETDFTSNNDNAAAYILKNGTAKFQDVTVAGGQITGTPIASIPNNTSTDIALLDFTHDLVFSVTDADTVAWATGTITMSNGRTFSITGSNTGNMAAKTYVYLDTGASLTALQTTTTASTAVGANKKLIAVAENGTGEATFTVFGANGGQNIDAASLVANSITANELSTSITYAGSIVIDTAGLIRSGQTDYNTGTGWWIGNDGGTPKFSIGNPSANYLTWDGSDLTINGYQQSTIGSFGGDGSDGALNISSGTTTIDLNNAQIVVKNYTSVSITGTGKLAFSNPHSGGTVVILKSQGGVTVTSSTTPCIDASGMGASAGAEVSRTTVGETSGNDGTDGTTFALVKTNKGTAATSGLVGSGGATGDFTMDLSKLSLLQATNNYPRLFVGAGGGSGNVDFDAGTGTMTSGAGGRGGGCLVIECAGAWNFTTSSGISVAGASGGNASDGGINGGAGGGGGGGGGCFIGLYNELTANSGSVTASGGTGGNVAQIGGNSGEGGGGGGSSSNAGNDGTQSTSGQTGGDGGAGLSLIEQNKTR